MSDHRATEDLHRLCAQRTRSSAAPSAVVTGTNKASRLPAMPCPELSGGCGFARRPVQMQQPRWGPHWSCRPRSRRARTRGSGRFLRATGPRRCGGPPVAGRSRRPISARSQCPPTRKTSSPPSSVARYSRQADYEVVSRCGQRGQAPVEAIEEPRPHLLPPGERAVWIAPGGQHATGHQMIRRHVQERFRQCLLHRLGQR